MYAFGMFYPVFEHHRWDQRCASDFTVSTRRWGTSMR